MLSPRAYLKPGGHVFNMLRSRYADNDIKRKGMQRRWKWCEN